MTSSEFNSEDVCHFAECLGLTGSDIDLFYEAYYALDSEAFDLLLEQEYEEVCGVA